MKGKTFILSGDCRVYSFVTVRTTDHSVVFSLVLFWILLRLGSRRIMFVLSGTSMPFTKNLYLSIVFVYFSDDYTL